MWFFRQEHWSGLLFPFSRDLLNPGIGPESPALADGFFTTGPPEKPSPQTTCKNAPRGKDVPELSMKLKKNLSIEITQIPGTFHCVCPWLLTFPPPHPCPGLPLLQANSLAKRLGHPPAKALCSFEKHARMFCVLFPEWSSHLEWSESKEARPGNRVLLDSRLGHVDISGWMCFVTIPLQEEIRILPRDSWDPRAGEGGGEEHPTPFRQGAGQTVISSQMFPCLPPSRRKWKITLPPTYVHTKGKTRGFFVVFFLRKGKHWEHFWR